MKARTQPVTHAEIRRAVEEEMDRQYEALYRRMAADLNAQNLGVVYWTLAKSFGWGEKRLKALTEALHDTDDLMEHPSRLHHRFSPLDCEKEIKERFGIDLRAEFPIRVEVQK
jgi:hypothetical protein